jgi:type IV pilus assembly protein PilC
MKYNYQARTKEGEIVAGTIEASSREAAINILQKHGFYITYLKVARPPFYAREVKIFQKTSLKDVVLFSRQLSIMFSSKISLVESLNTIAVQTTNLEFREIILDISKEVEGGSPFSKALSRQPQIFSPFYIAMVKSGEMAGKLSESLNYLADHLEREYHLNSRIQGAMIYPALVALVILAVLFAMMFYVVPELTKIFEETSQDLPLVTQLVIKLSSFLRKWGIFSFAFFVISVIFFQKYIKTSEGKKNFDRISLRLPLIGSSLKMVYLSRFAENLSTLISGGIPVAQALETSGEIVGNTVYKDVIFLTRDEVRKGENISSVLQEYPEIFPPVFSQMTLVGEKTGTLDKTLLNLVNFYQKEVDRNIDNLLSILEPLLIVFLGLSVAGLMMSVLLPIYKMAAF